MSDPVIDTTAFLSDKFDVQDYAKAVLQGRPYRPDDYDETEKGKGVARATDGQGERGDVGVELARLNQGIEDVTRQLRQEITASYPLLLTHLTTSLSLSSNLAPIRSSLTSLSSSMDRLHQKIHVPHEQLATLVRRLSVLAQASDLTRRASRFVLVAKRLEGQMQRMSEAESGAGEGEKERELAKAALSVAELDGLLHPSSSQDEEEDTDGPQLPLIALDFVRAHAPTVDKSRDVVIQEMENMIFTGLADLNQALLSSSLQTAHNLRLLPDLVSNLLADLNDAVKMRISKAFDSAAIGREVAGKDTQQKSSINFAGRSRQATEPNSSNQQQWVQVLWARLERVIEDVANCCIKVYTLEKVLRMKKDSVTQMEFLEEVMKRLDEKPSFTFWTTLAQSFESQTKEAARNSAWLQQALSTGYPRLLRLFHDFFAKIAVHTDTVYTRDQQSPEAVLVLRSVSSFETLYLTRSTSRINDAVNTALSNYVSSKAQLGPSEGVNIARVITNELDSAKFDPLLVRTVARNGVKVLDAFVNRLDGMIVRDFTATSLIGPQSTAAENVNAQFASCLYHCWYNLTFVETEFPGKVWDILRPAVSNLQTTYTRITTPLDTAFKREASTIMARIHKVDFSRPVDPMSMGGQGGSPYMQDLTDKLAFIKREILGRLSMGDFMRDWVLGLSRHLITVFLLHASIVRPLGESGKLKLTTDMTELEISIQSLLATGQPMGAKSTSSKSLKLSQIGDEYLALRSLRTILFSDLKTLANPVETVHLPTAVVLHHIIVHGPLRLPHEVHGWSEAEYVLWLQKHSPLEIMDLIDKAVQSQTSGDASVPGDDEDEETIKLVREVLTHAKEAEDVDLPAE